jgi:hypothetical protein
MVELKCGKGGHAPPRPRRPVEECCMAFVVTILVGLVFGAGDQ